MTLHCAGYGAVIKDPEIRESKSGSEYANILVSIDNGADAEGKELTLVLKLFVFSDLVEEARKLKKADRCYFEGSANQIKIWESDKGPKPDIQIRLHHLRRTATGKDKPKREREPDQSNGANAAYSSARERPQVQGRDRFDFDDRLPF
jgi:single-stranded DNA-binding protein